MDSKDQVEYTGNGTAGREADVQPTGFFFQMPQREWQGLTDEEILEEYRQSYGDDGNLTDVYFARAIESKLKDKNT